MLLNIRWLAVVDGDVLCPLAHVAQPLFEGNPAAAMPFTDHGNAIYGCRLAVRPESMSSLLDALRDFERSPDYRRAPQAVQTLAQALAQQLRVALRDALLTSQPHATVHPQPKEEGANNHV